MATDSISPFFALTSIKSTDDTDDAFVAKQSGMQGRKQSQRKKKKTFLPSVATENMRSPVNKMGVCLLPCRNIGYSVLWASLRHVYSSTFLTLTPPSLTTMQVEQVRRVVVGELQYL